MRRRSATWTKAAALGAVVGSRSLLVPALVGRSARRGGGSRVWTLLAAFEMVADKTPWIPSRTAPVSLAGRMLVGAAVAFAMAPRSTPAERAGRALVGASFATASAYLLRALRVRLGARNRAANVVGGAIEDLLAVGAGLALTRS